MKDISLGLKLFSNQLEQYKNEAVQILDAGKAQYIELFVHPNHLNFLNRWVDFKNKYNIEFTLHAPHSSQGVNLGLPENFEQNKEAYKDVMEYKKALDAQYIVVHSGRDGSIEETVRQLKLIEIEDVMIENKPYVSPRNPSIISRGATVEEIKYVLDNYNCKGFCLDIGHAFCTAVSLNIDQYEYLKRFQLINPSCYHLSDGEFNNPIDIHYHLTKGDYNWNKIFSIIDHNKNMTIETIKKNSTESLENFKIDLDFVRHSLHYSAA